MPTHRIKESRSLLEIFAEFSPKVLSNGQIRMMCPFRDNHPDGSGQMSFFINPSINAYHCFSCGAKGNLIRLLTTQFGVNYFEAAGMVQLSDYTPEKKEFDLDVMWDTHKLPKEFLDRGYPKEILQHFKVGTTDDGEILIPYYRSFVKPTELLGYQRRWYKPDRGVRNSKGFNKKEYLYNLDTSYNYVVLVEGQSDVWRVYQHGYNVTALMGSSISDWQVEQLSKFKRVYLALDNDETGRRITEICYERLKNHTDVKLVPYITKDPGECKKADWVSAFEGSTDYLTYSLEMTMNWDGYLDFREKILNEMRHKTDL